VLLMLAAFTLPAPATIDEPQGLSAAWPALRVPHVAAGMWLTGLAGIAFGILDVLAPLRLNHLGVDATLIGVTFLLSAGIESGLAPMAGRLSDRRGPLVPVRIALGAAVVVSLLAPVVAPAAALIVLLILGMPAYGSLFTPAMAMLSSAAHRMELNQGLAFGMCNLSWAAGQGIAAAAGGAIAQATTDFVPYSLLAAACLLTLLGTGKAGKRVITPLLAWRLPASQQAEGQQTKGQQAKGQQTKGQRAEGQPSDR
jgi:MFS family permease